MRHSDFIQKSINDAISDARDEFRLALDNIECDLKGALGLSITHSCRTFHKNNPEKDVALQEIGEALDKWRALVLQDADDIVELALKAAEIDFINKFSNIARSALDNIEQF